MKKGGEGGTVGTLSYSNWEVMLAAGSTAFKPSSFDCATFASHITALAIVYFC